MLWRVPGGKAVLATFEMRLENAVDHIVVVQRVNDVLEQTGSRLGRLAVWQFGDGVEDQLVCPSVVTRQHASGAEGGHGVPCRLAITPRNRQSHPPLRASPAGFVANWWTAKRRY